MLKGWQDVFGTSDKREVEKDLRSSQLDFAWQKRNSLKIVNKEAAVETHPETGDKVWFNHVQVKLTHTPLNHRSTFDITHVRKIFPAFIKVCISE